MGAPTEYYVDPSLGSDTGNGTVGTPWGRASTSVVQHALDTITRDATNGDRINVKAGSADTVTSGLDFTTYGTSLTNDVPLIIQGYTSTAGDGGQGEIDGGGTTAILSSTSIDAVWAVDMKLGNCGSNLIWRGDDWCKALRCEFHTSTATQPVVHFDSLGEVFGCYLHDVVNGIDARDGNVNYNYIDLGTGSGRAILGQTASDPTICNNIIKLNNVGATGIYTDSANAGTGRILNNSIYNAAAATGSAIQCITGANGVTIANNLIEGFSGTGGIGIEVDSGETFIILNNGFYNCATNISGGPGILDLDNESLGASPFASTTTFQPADTGNIISGSYPTADISATITYYRDKGAVQLEPSAGGGGGCKLVGPGGGMIG